ncbi:hypothetical protein PGT21_000043 [Puccinia graminis f. sp. tritici]|uniref:Uncharacterized protein n=1 Tax=Puccinia graminis f. sp. tritici TaxID=56615 RepID=A0A5B0Q178_PUCGR|nr:hypothetical protein PGT21_000043 [Puccinia graminis f. sp. tritici]
MLHTLFFGPQSTSEPSSHSLSINPTSSPPLQLPSTPSSVSSTPPTVALTTTKSLICSLDRIAFAFSLIDQSIHPAQSLAHHQPPQNCIAHFILNPTAIYLSLLSSSNQHQHLPSHPVMYNRAPTPSHNEDNDNGLFNRSTINGEQQ